MVRPQRLEWSTTDVADDAEGDDGVDETMEALPSERESRAAPAGAETSCISPDDTESCK